MKRISSIIVMMMLMVTVASAQIRYKHVPRVKVDVNKTKNTFIQQEPAKEAKVTITNTAPVAISPVVNENVVVAEENLVASKSNEVAAPVKAKKSTIKKHKELKVNKKADKQIFTEKVKNKSKLLDVKDAEKTNANVALILLIVFYILAFIFILAAVLVLLSTSIYDFTLFLVLLIIGITFALAASVLLTLMKLGVF